MFLLSKYAIPLKNNKNKEVGYYNTSVAPENFKQLVLNKTAVCESHDPCRDNDCVKGNPETS